MLSTVHLCHNMPENTCINQCMLPTCDRKDADIELADMEVSMVLSTVSFSMGCSLGVVGRDFIWLSCSSCNEIYKNVKNIQEIHTLTYLASLVKNSTIKE